jgi:hypothetical protein
MKKDHLHVDCSRKWRHWIRSSKRHRKSDVRRAVARLMTGTTESVCRAIISEPLLLRQNTAVVTNGCPSHDTISGATNTLVGLSPYSVTQESNGVPHRMLLTSELVWLLFLAPFVIYSSELGGRDSAFGIAIRYGLDGPGIESQWGEIFRSRPDRPWSPPSLLYNRYRVFPGGKAAGTWRWPPTLSNTEVKERVEQYLYSPSGPSWPVIGWTLPYFFTVRNSALWPQALKFKGTVWEYTRL